MVNKFKNITEEMVELYEKKNSDYGDSVHDTYVKYGPVSFLVRMEDKINRVKKLTETDYSSQVTDEKVRDSLIDLANYAILMVMEMERESSMRVSCADTIAIVNDVNGLACNNKWDFTTERSDE